MKSWKKSFFFFDSHWMKRMREKIYLKKRFFILLCVEFIIKEWFPIPKPSFKIKQRRIDRSHSKRFDIFKIKKNKRSLFDFNQNKSIQYLMHIQLKLKINNSKWSLNSFSFLFDTAWIKKQFGIQTRVGPSQIWF